MAQQSWIWHPVFTPWLPPDILWHPLPDTMAGDPARLSAMAGDPIPQAGDLAVQKEVLATTKELLAVAQDLQTGQLEILQLTFKHGEKAEKGMR